MKHYFLTRKHYGKPDHTHEDYDEIPELGHLFHHRKNAEYKGFLCYGIDGGKRAHQRAHEAWEEE